MSLCCSYFSFVSASQMIG